MANAAEQIIAGLGGIDNIVAIEGGPTRLRTEVEDAALIDEEALRAAGTRGIVRMGTAVQVVVGERADAVAADIEELL